MVAWNQHQAIEKKKPTEILLIKQNCTNTELRAL